ncbi:putative 2OG-Fe(II) oxygenase [Prochlorococcus marinus]|uniref:putative 2OG-Fe(II) oxygenase n=1 Tax=Prochlorococcus marinus TaxID=1219 RepID=UPI0022B33ABF|nr:putative 2OG-Fe(II) oxygenase [Prochlorococcus marinus]
MEVTKISPPVSGFLQVRLDQEIIDYLWKIIDTSQKNKNKNAKGELIGNISKSILLEDIDSFFFKSVCVPLIKYYRETNITRTDPVARNALLGPKSKLVLDKLWVNYQYKTEFNPYHDHSGVYSFAIWLKIPYGWLDLKKLPQYNDMNDDDIKAGCFEFEYNDSLGGVQNYSYRLSPELEGVMVFFPAKLRHCVYPFYETDEPRISIAGNLSYLPS